MDLTFQGDRLAGAVALRFFAVRLSFPIRHLTSIEYILSVLQMEVESRVRKRLNSATTSNPEEKRMDRPDTKINRRKFLQKGAVVAAGSATLSTTALSYARIAGANDRISLGHIGIGNRGRELDGIVALLKDKKNVEVTRSEEHTSELQSRLHLVCRLLLEKKKKRTTHRDKAIQLVV